MADSWKIDKYALAVGSRIIRRCWETKAVGKLRRSITVHAKDRDLSSCPPWLESYDSRPADWNLRRVGEVSSIAPLAGHDIRRSRNSTVRSS